MPILREGELDIISHSTQQTMRFGARLGKLLRAGDVVCLSGDMGAGKTVFAAGIGQGWGSRYPLTSPTYTLVHEHQRSTDGARLHHLDCYRLEGPQDADSVGLDDLLDDPGILVIEWPERIQEYLPAEHLWIEFRVVDDTRRSFMLEGTGARYQTLIEQFRDATFGMKSD